jgi:hypothetical protein
MTWKQAKEPFTKKEKEYIESINIIEDMRKLNSYIYLRPECWKYFRISNTVLKVCTRYNLTPFEIGSLLYHFDYDNKTPSKIKIIIEKTEKITIDLNSYKRFRLLSFEGNKNNKYDLNKRKTSSDNVNRVKENKKRVNSFFREDRGHRKSLLETTASAPKDKDSKEKEIEND